MLFLKRVQTDSLRQQFLRIAAITSLPLLLLLVTSNFLVFFASERLMRVQMENISSTLQNSIEIQLDSMIQAYLKAKVESGLDILRFRLENPQIMTMDSLEAIFLDSAVGFTGYYYVLDSSGRMLIHPDEAFLGRDLSGLSPMTEQIARKTGYLEYSWQNTDEDESYPKALWMEYVPELDWILSATTYRSEFTSLVDREALRAMILEGDIGDSGYSFIIDRSARMIVHPAIGGEGSDWYEAGSQDNAELIGIVEKFFETKEGFVRYRWRDVSGGRRFVKIAFLHYLPDYDWIVGTSIRRAEIMRPGILFAVTNFCVAAVVAAVFMAVLARINRGMEDQLSRIVDVLAVGRSGDLSVRIGIDGPEEIAELAHHINYFLGTLQGRTLELERLNESLEEEVVARTDELTETSRRLMESEKQAMTSHLVAGLAHEISNPMGMAQTAFTFAADELGKLSTALEEGSPDPVFLKETMGGITETTEIALANLGRARNLLQSFRSVSRDQLSQERRDFLLGNIINDVLMSMRPVLKKKRVEVSVDVPPIALDSYPGAFVHIFVNFISNTLKHGFRDRREGSINISADVSEDELTIEYSDNGRGIAPDVTNRIFEPFVTTGRDSGSTGLGLNIVHGLITETLGGSVEVESKPGKFTRFIIRIPETPPEPKKDSDAASEDAASEDAVPGDAVSGNAASGDTAGHP